MDRRDASLRSGFSAATVLRRQPDSELVALRHLHDNHRRPAHYLGRHRLDPNARRDKPGRQHAPLAHDFGGGGGFGCRPALRWLGLLARQCGRAWLLDFRHTHLADDASGNWHGLLWPLRLHRRSGHYADSRHGHQLHRQGFQRGTHTRWQLVANDGTGAPTLTDMGASFAIATGGVVTLFIAAAPNGSTVWVRVVDEVTGVNFEQEISNDLPAVT